MAKQSKRDGPLDLSVAGIQTFTVAKIHRGELKKAAYNPRTLGDMEKRKLREGIKRHGLVEPIVWNKRTGNICGGHQRIGQLDALAGTADYTLDVAVIDVDDKSEKEINVLLNNNEAQGDWDLDLLGDLVKDSGLEIEGMGFDHADVFRIFGDSAVLTSSDATFDEFADKLRAARERYEKVKENSAKRADENFYIVVVFRDTDALDAFIKRGPAGQPYQSGEDLKRLCGFEDVGE
jgi:ParB-like chromosome segregation protein Spo0J